MNSTSAEKLALSLCKLIKQHRTLTCSQAEFAERLGVTRNTVSALESAKNVSLQTLCEALVILELDGEFVDLANELTQDVVTDQLRQRKIRKQEPLDNDF